MTGNIVFDETGGQYIGKGLIDTQRGGSYGLSLVCSVGYQFNWQAGWILATEQNGTTPRPLYLDSVAGTTLRVWDEQDNSGVEVSHTGITFADETTQTTAGIVTVNSLAGDSTGDLTLSAADVGAAEASHTHSLSDLLQSNATAGQVVTWSGEAWVADDPAGGGFSGSYDDLTNKPTLGTAAAASTSDFAAASHSHPASAITSGTFDASLLPLATTGTAGAIIVGSGLSVASGTVSAAVTSVAGRTGAVTLSASDVSGLGTLATQSGTFSGTSSGTNTGDQTITLTGDVTGSGTGSFAATLANSGVSAGTYTSVTVNSKGLVTAGSSPAVAYSSLSGVPSTFTPPIATASVLGGVRQGSNVTIAADGTISVAAPVTSLPYASITGTPTLAAVATSGSASDISAGTLSASRLPTSGVSAGTYTSVTVDTYGRVTAGSSPAVAYSSLSGVPSTFAPSAHASSHASGGSDEISIAASQITSGTIATARLASGSASATTYLRGDQTWATVSGGSATTSASDLTSGILDDQRLSAKSQAAMNLYLWSNFR
jgi:hypothetical protein